MNNAKPCKDRFEDIVALVMGESNPSDARQLQDHIAQCDKCREIYVSLVEEEKEVRSGFEALARNLGPIGQAVLGQPKTTTDRRTNMVRLTRYSMSAVAVVLFLAVGAWWMLFSPGARNAWAEMIDRMAQIQSATCSLHTHRGGSERVSKTYLKDREFG